jgi:hypothetical protein
MYEKDTVRMQRNNQPTQETGKETDLGSGNKIKGEEKRGVKKIIHEIWEGRKQTP